MASEGLCIGTVDENSKNAESVWCPWCDTKIINAGVGTLIEQSIRLHKPNASREAAFEEQSFDILSDFWLVTDKFDFENIAVTKAIVSDPEQAQSGGAPDAKYLTCAACDRGPVGILFLSNPNNFYVARTRVRYNVESNEEQ
eukprot:TRINITY_DN6498_c0_g3_i3.p1 TRINITY_DN6498_c0_g3~~TRINITY_DN6498_c0_g3_i3.p1  ORF type:complete len:142 (+),score=17.79 TRINITY_DN6498_c0_g3_i3:56-481(+)